MYQPEKFFLLLFFLALPSVARADLEALKYPHELNLRLVPISAEPIDELGIKTIHVVENRLGMEARWSSQTHSAKNNQPWPEFEVELHQGWIQTDNWRSATSLLHPHFWAQGYYRLDQNGILWAPPELLSLAKNKRKEFLLEPGLLTDSFEHFAKGPTKLIENVTAFRNIVLPFQQNTVMPSPSLGQKEIDAMKQFVADFIHVKVKTSRLNDQLIIDGKSQTVPVILVGNAYVEYSILDYPTNPLVLSLKFLGARAPALVKPALDYFVANLAYEITQISTK